MSKDNNKDSLAMITGIVMSFMLLVIWIVFDSFVNMYVWNNVLLHFFELPTITLVGGFGIGIIKDAFIIQILATDRDASAFEYQLHTVSFRATVLLFAWIFTLFV